MTDTMFSMLNFETHFDMNYDDEATIIVRPQITAIKLQNIIVKKGKDLKNLFFQDGKSCRQKFACEIHGIAVK